MKKIIYSILTIIALSMILFTSCEKDPEVPDINVGFQFAPEAPVAGQTVTFTNASNGGATFAWEFGDGETATTKNPTHVYTTADTYTVTLKVDGFDELTYSKDIVVAEPAPIITYAPQPVESGKLITFSADIYNPDGDAVVYTWQFPADNVDSEMLDENGVGIGETLDVRFINPTDAADVTVSANIGGKDLESSVAVEVKAQLAATLFLAEKGGNIWTKKLYLEGEAELVDFGIEAGPHPLTLSFSEDKLFVFNAGDYITYTTEFETNPGQIFSVGFDGNNYVTHLTFGVESAYDDAFFGDVVDGNIYFTDRRNDVTKIPVSTENAQWGEGFPDANPEAFPALVANGQLAYYSAYRPDIDGGPTYGWGALNGGFTLKDGTYWWAKNANHKGLWRFQDDDINVLDKVPEEDGILTDYGVRTFAFDDVNQKIYFSSNNGLERGFFVCDMDGSNVTMIDDSPYDGEGGENEPTFITGIAVDNESGYVYWAYRAPEASDPELNPLHRSGIKQFKLDGSGDVEFFIEDVEVYGITIDHAKR